jgi:hypothetical protein
MRLDGWEKRLDTIIQANEPFTWGTNDCCMFAVRCVDAITSVDHGKKYRGYKTAVGAAKRLEKHGGVDGIATECLGEPKSVKLAKRGDVIMIDSGDGYALGVCIGSKIAAVSKDGLTFIPMSQALKAWGV